MTGIAQPLISKMKGAIGSRQIATQVEQEVEYHLIKVMFMHPIIMWGPCLNTMLPISFNKAIICQIQIIHLWVSQIQIVIRCMSISMGRWTMKVVISINTTSIQILQIGQHYKITSIIGKIRLQSKQKDLHIMTLLIINQLELHSFNLRFRFKSRIQI